MSRWTRLILGTDKYPWRDEESETAMAIRYSMMDHSFAEGDIWCTRRGQRAKIFMVNIGTRWPLVGAICRDEKSNSWTSEDWTERGRVGLGDEHLDDLASRISFTTEKPQMKLSIGKFYKTERGLKARVHGYDGPHNFPIIGAVYLDQAWHPQAWGLNGVGTIYAPSGDIVGEWSDFIAAEPGQKRQMRDGTPVKIYATDAGGAYPIHGAYRDRDGSWKHCAWSREGRWVQSQYSHHDYDLV